MGSIYLIRHGQASLGAANYDVLSPLGVIQSQVLGQHLQRTAVTFQRILSGSMLRQSDTAKHALQQMTGSTGLFESDPAFNEYPADTVIKAYLPRLLESQPEAMLYLENAGQHRKEFQKIFSRIIGWWVSDTALPAGCPSWQHYAEKVLNGLQRLQREADSGNDIAVFTSGGAITAAVQQITQMPVASAFELNWQIVNTSVTRLQFGREKISLAGFNCRAHLDIDPRPDLVTYR
ncbi:MAG: histidine phosphatase family protein [Halopseudomonas yangmingensis]|uniref:Broad specificity phosphatase PhoE n=1 Tax=Halopseudomonas yangmingensis TaxID=1720063 RepID=A0A1I4RMK0_9GAMM|nr:histidine phosphatase family protein [Halopseudomonas yangmingensis]SFM53457.1 Broad specificity phosphatase PhoE [Halopseudomonas yangmingensis]